MNESEWDKKLKGFLDKTGRDLKRLGRDVKEEAEKLMQDVKDPVRQERLKKEVTGLAMRVADDVTSLVDVGVKKAESALGEAQKRAAEFMAKPAKGQVPDAAPTPPNPTPVHEASASSTRPTNKTIGTSPKPKTGPKKRTVKKSMGK
jgi:hypothetical protein